MPSANRADGSQPPLDPSAGPPAAFGTPEALGPPMKFIQATKSVTTTTDEGELSVNRAVTFGGIIRQHGQIVRVSSAADGPAFCPS